jgi:hypothetical protein
MMPEWNKLGIFFDQTGNTIVSQKKLEQLLEQSRLGNLYCAEKEPPGEGYLLIEYRSNDLYPFPFHELEEWERDGSLQPGDRLFRITLVKEY